MKVIVGCDTGICKVIQLDNRSIQTFGVPEKNLSVDILKWADFENLEQDILIGTNNMNKEKKSSTICLFDLESLSSNWKLERDDIIKGIEILERRQNTIKLALCFESGILEVVQCNENNQLVLNKFTVSSPIARMKLQPGNKQYCGIGGKNNDISLWNLTDGKCTWKAKNLGPDKFGLPLPIWVTDFAFLVSQPTKIVVISAHNYFRVYDIEKQRKPILSVKLPEIDHPLIALELDAQEKTAFCSDSTGKVLQVDINTGLLVGSFPGVTGSTRGLKIHSSLPFLAACGLDRFIRVFDVASRKLQKKIYVKQRMNCLLFSKEEEVETNVTENKDSHDDVWNSISVIQEENNTESTQENAVPSKKRSNSENNNAKQTMMKKLKKIRSFKKLHGNSK